MLGGGAAKGREVEFGESLGGQHLAADLAAGKGGVSADVILSAIVLRETNEPEIFETVLLSPRYREDDNAAKRRGIRDGGR